jgi:N4-gp56 family major capsid protein
MATTNFAVGNALTEKIWGKKAFKDSVKDTLYGKLIGKSDRSIIQIKDETQKGPGDRIRFRLRALPTGTGKDGHETLEGSEEGLSYSYMDMTIDQKRHATKVDLGISQQRVGFELRSEAKDALTEWWEDYLDTTMIEYLSGASTLTYHTSNVLASNALEAPSQILYGGNATAKNDVDATDTFTLALIDKAVEFAKLKTPTMRKAQFGGKSAYVMLLHPYQVYDLRTNTNTGQWLDIQKAAMNGGKVEKNPIFSEALGVYNGVILIENTRVNTFSDYGSGGNVDAARALFMGAQAGVTAYGRKTPGTSRMSWKEKSFDYGDKLGVASSLIWGMYKTRFDSADFGMVHIDTAATSHT